MNKSIVTYKRGKPMEHTLWDYLSHRETSKDGKHSMGVASHGNPEVDAYKQSHLVNRIKTCFYIKSMN